MKIKKQNKDQKRAISPSAKMLLIAFVSSLFMMGPLLAQAMMLGSTHAKHLSKKDILFLQSPTQKIDDDHLLLNHDSIERLNSYTQECIKTGLIRIDLFINPPTNEILIRFFSNHLNFTSIRCYDEEDHLIFEKPNLYAKEGQSVQVKIQAGELKLHKGKYTLFIRNNEQVYIKKLVLY